MRIGRFSLSNYDRIQLHGHTFFDIIPCSKITLILGKNSSGKSSVMSELTPLAGLHKDYSKPGKKYMECSHNGNEFKLTSDFQKANRFSFVMNGEELNKGGTMSVFNELVKQHLGVTPESHQIMLGNKPFSLLNSAERRKMIIALSGVDYEPSIVYYNRLKNEQRDIIGALKLLTSKAMVESSKLSSDTNIDALRNKIIEDNGTIEKLIRLANNNQKRPTSNSLTSKLEQLVNIADSKLRSVSGSCMDIKSYSALAASLETIIKEETKNIAKITEEIVKLEANYARVGNNNATKVSDLKEKINSLEKERSEVASFLTGILDSSILGPMTENRLKDALLLEEIIQDICSHGIPDSDDIDFSSKALASRETELNIYGKKLREEESRFSELTARLKEIEHLKTHSHVECPNCAHQWYTMYKKEDHDSVLSSITLSIALQKDLTSSIESLSGLVTSNKAVIEARKELVRACEHYHKPILQRMKELGVFHKTSTKIMTFIREAVRECTILKNILIIDEKLIEVGLDMKAAIESGDVDADTLLKKITELKVQYNHSLCRIDMMKSELSDVKFVLRNSEELLELQSSLEGCVSSSEEHFVNMIDHTFNEFILGSIRNISTRVSEMERTVNAVDNQKKVVDDINVQLEDYKARVDVYDKVLDELSPSSGMIARTLIGFIKKFVTNINKVIALLWSYQLELKVTEVLDPDNGLDFKFPVIVNGREIEDVSLGSTAVKSVINFAVVLTYMKYKGLTDYPIFLDEFASSFDEEHREAAVGFIKRLSEMDDVGQIFIISHYKEIHGSFPTSEIVQL